MLRVGSCYIGRGDFCGKNAVFNINLLEQADLTGTGNRLDLVGLFAAAKDLWS